MEFKFYSNNVEDTYALAKLLAPHLEISDVLLLKGDLGAGKTTFVKGLGLSFGVKGEIQSPTFNILKCYFESTPPLYHIDAYRLEGQNIDIGLDEWIGTDGITVIEWPQYIEPLLPKETLSLVFHRLGDKEREITLLSDNPHYDEIVRKIQGEINA